MSIPQPIATDNLDAPDHSLLHRQIVADTAAPAKSLIADSAGKIGIGTETPAQKLDVVGSIQLSGNLTDGTNASSPANIKDAVDKKHAASGQFNQATAAEISGLTEKTTPVDADVLLIEDSAASYAKKKILKSSLAGGMQYTDTRFKLGSFTRDTSLASGTQAITGVGFSPKAVVLFLVQDNTFEASWGFDNAAAKMCTLDYASAGNFYSTTSYSLYDDDAAGDYVGSLSSLDSDGFTVNWTKIASPTGTVVIGYLAFR